MSSPSKRLSLSASPKGAASNEFHTNLHTSAIDDSFSTNYDTSLFEDDSDFEEILERARRKRENNDLIDYGSLDAMRDGVHRLTNLTEQRSSSDSDSIISVVPISHDTETDSETQILNTLMVMDDDEDSTTALMATEHLSPKKTKSPQASLTNLSSLSNRQKSPSKVLQSSKSDTVVSSAPLNLGRGYEGDNEIDNKKSIELDREWELERKNRELERKIAGLEEQLIASQRREKNATISHKNESELVRQIQEQNSQLSTENKRLESQKASLKERIDYLTNINQELTQKIENLLSENRKLNDTVLSTQEKTTRSSDMQRSNEQLSQKVSALEKQVEQQTTKISDLEDLNKKLGKELRIKLKQLKHQEGDLVNFVKEFDQTKSQYTSFIEKYEKMIHKLEEYKRGKATLKQKVATLNQEIGSLTEENKQLMERQLKMATKETVKSRSQSPNMERGSSPFSVVTPASKTGVNQSRSSSTGRGSSTVVKGETTVVPPSITNISNMSANTMPLNHRKTTPTSAQTRTPSTGGRPNLAPSNSASKQDDNQENIAPRGQLENNIFTDDETEVEEDFTPKSAGIGVPFYKDPEYLRKKLSTERKRVELKNIEIAGLKELLYNTTIVKSK